MLPVVCTYICSHDVGSMIRENFPSPSHNLYFFESYIHNMY